MSASLLDATQSSTCAFAIQSQGIMVIKYKNILGQNLHEVNHINITKLFLQNVQDIRRQFYFKIELQCYMLYAFYS